VTASPEEAIKPLHYIHQPGGDVKKFPTSEEGSLSLSL
jgi:hypothetical protein